MTASDYIGLNWYLLNSDFNDDNDDVDTEVIYYEVPILRNFIPSKYNNGSIYKLFLNNVELLCDDELAIDELLIHQCVFYSLAYEHLTPAYTNELFYNILDVLQEYGYSVNKDSVNDLCLFQFYNYVILIQNTIKLYLKLNMENAKIAIDEIEDGYEDSKGNYKPMKVIIKRKKSA